LSFVLRFVFAFLSPLIIYQVAVKILHDGDGAGREDLVAETELLHSVRHPNLLTCSAVFRWQDKICLEMQYMDVGDLSAASEALGKFNLAPAMAVCREVKAP
jgi:serine/threonine protein kinase